VPVRRIFLLGAATLVSCAALVAISAILTGEFGSTEGKIFATLATAFVAGSSVLAAIACLERGVSRPFGLAGIVLATFGFLLWADQIWDEHSSSGYWKLLGLVLTWTLVTLMATTTRLLTRSPELLRTLYRATVASAVGAGLVVTAMIVRDNGDAWQLFAVLLILAALGEILTPILERFVVTPVDAAGRSERVLGALGGAVVVAVRNGRPGRRVLIGDEELSVAEDETIVVRPA
jgi:hypothetical protein